MSFLASIGKGADARVRLLTALPLLIGGLLGLLWCGFRLPGVVAWVQPQTELYAGALAHGFRGSLGILRFTGVALFAVVLLAGGLGLSPGRSRVRLIRLGYYAGWLWIALHSLMVWRWLGLASEHGWPLAGEKLTEITLFFWRLRLLWPFWALGGLAFFLYLLSRRACVAAAYGIPVDGPTSGDRILENLRTGGREPVYRRSLWRSGVLHFVALIVIPWLLTMPGCVTDYEVPHGSGDPVVALVRTVKPQKKKPRRKLALRPNSAILFNAPDLDDSALSQEVEESTLQTYSADNTGAAGSGRMGAGGGTTGGWPEGTGQGLIRFVRLEYSGADWDDGMGAVDDADANFLREFQKATGFRVAERGESHGIRSLRRYSPGKAPPFVYMTGSGQIHVPQGDLAILRDYLDSGGMLFADCGSPAWDRSFRSFAAALYPGEPLRVIADDDRIFQAPYSFPNGAPPLWHHGGMKALGIRKDGRWIVFYHPGDINDAWKTGHSGIDSRMAAGAFQMGINIIHYAFTHYLEATRAERK